MRLRFSPLLLASFLLFACERPQRQTSEQPPQTFTKASTPPADSLLAVGESHYKAAEYDSARAVWQHGMSGARARRDDTNEARFMSWLAILAWKIGDFPEARRVGERALALKQRLSMRDEIARNYNTLGLTANAEFRLTDAQTLFRQSMDAARAVNDREGVARAAGNLGLAETYLGNLEAGRELLRTQLNEGRALQNDRFQANALANLAMVNLWAGDPLPAVAQLDSARALYTILEQEDGLPNLLGQLAEAYTAMGDFPRAFAAVDTAITIAGKLELTSEQIENQRLAAGLHAQLGDYRRATNLYTQADDLARRSGFGAQRALILRRRAEVHLALGNGPAGLRDAREAVRLDEAAGAHFDAVDDYITLANALHASRSRDAARAALERARELARATNARSARVSVILADARLADREQDGARVLQILKAGATEFAPRDFDVSWEVDALAARAYARTGNLDSAAVVGRRAVVAVQMTRSALTAEPLRASYTAERSDVFADLVVVLLRQNRTAEAFAIADAARGNALLGYLANARREIAGTAAGQVEASDLLRRIDVLVGQLRTIERVPPRERGAATTTLTAVQRKLDELRAEYETRHIRAMQSHPRAALIAPENPNADAVSRVLGSNEALIEYMVVPERIVAFVVTRAGVQVMETGADTADVATQLRVLRNVWSSDDARWRDALPAAGALYTELVAPLERVIRNTRRLVIVPHGLLAQLPFAALANPAGGFLVQTHEISYAPSASAFVALRAASGGALTIRRAIAFAPSPDELPASVAEARAVRTRMWRANAVIGAAATERALREALEQKRIVHVAGHGIMNARNPMFSRIEMARTNNPADGDGRLEVHELLGLTVKSPLVFLSGCETAAGAEWLQDLVRGTSEMTLSQAFLYSGASAVVATLWRIDDTGAAHFADAFYRALPFRSIPAALGAAQRSMISDPRYASPYYWAAYKLSGGTGK